MRRFRRFYYDIFSHFYDLVIQLHSKDESSTLRDFLIKKTGIGPGDRVLDICTGTGAVAMAAHKVIVPKGLVGRSGFFLWYAEQGQREGQKKGAFGSLSGHGRCG